MVCNERVNCKSNLIGLSCTYLIIDSWRLCLLKSKVLVVEDNETILFNTKLLLEFNDFEVITALNGLEAVKVLSSSPEVPDLILCDIIMPEMDGYEFFNKVSNNPMWTRIPFVFVTAKTDPDDIRFAKMLGVDDYIVKPFEERDLLASIKGKIERSKKNRLWSEKFEKVLLKSINEPFSPSNDDYQKSKVNLFLMNWDESYGPKVEFLYPTDIKPSYDVNNVGNQLFQTAASIYGYQGYFEAQGVLLRVANIERDGYLYFDTFSDPEVRGGRRQFMLATVAPQINYFESLRIKEIFIEIGNHLKAKTDWNITDYWLKILEILSSSF